LPKTGTSLSDFYHLALGGSPSSALSCQISLLRFKKVGLQPPKSRKMAIFGITLPLKQNSGDSYEKLNIGAQLETFLYAITP